MKKKEIAPGMPQCSVDYAFGRIGGKHKGRILWHLQDGVLRYGQLQRAITGITPKMLTQTLRELEEDKLIVRQVYLEVPPRVEYWLTRVAGNCCLSLPCSRRGAKSRCGQITLHRCTTANWFNPGTAGGGRPLLPDQV
jgi:DNA-binding HxlR family transcriptional regulator